MRTRIQTPKKILIIGSTCVDIIINVDHLPKTEEDIHPFSQSMALGGCAYNAANIIRQFGAPHTFISPVGTGVYGDYVRKELKQKGFPVLADVLDQENGCCYCLVERGGERTFMSLHGAEYTFSRTWMEPFEKETFDMTYVCGLEVEEPTGNELLSYLEDHREQQIFYAPGPRGILIEKEKTERMLALHPVLHINEAEACALSGYSQAREAAEALAQRTENTVIVTLGKDGACCLEKDGSFYQIPAYPAQVADTVGAGDSHIGTVMACLSLGYNMREALHTAGRVSAAVVSVKGASLTEEEFSKLDLKTGF